MEAFDICSYTLKSIDDSMLPAFTAGSHIDVHLPNKLIRQYSIVNSPSDRSRYVIGVLRDARSRGGSSSLHDDVKQGDILNIGYPRNQFSLVPAASESVLLAGGIGITPLLCMAHELSSGSSEFRLHYAGRTRDRMAFLSTIRNSPFADRVVFHSDDSSLGEPIHLSDAIGQPAPGKRLYVCGPQGFIDAATSQARTIGWNESHVHFERFARPSYPSERNQQETSFAVRLARSNRCVNVGAHQSVAEALIEAGIPLPTSCEQGVCGTCLTVILDGIPEHRDSFLTSEERVSNRHFLPCCSRSHSPVLTLDL
jgi:vanillate O-demethylase ferredoxin subunit